MWFKTEVIIFVYNAYIDGLSVEEISLKTRYCEDIGEISHEDINSIIDDINLTI
jgi:hypothetical protein